MLAPLAIEQLAPFRDDMRIGLIGLVGSRNPPLAIKQLAPRAVELPELHLGEGEGVG